MDPVNNQLSTSRIQAHTGNERQKCKFKYLLLSVVQLIQLTWPHTHVCDSKLHTAAAKRTPQRTTQKVRYVRLLRCIFTALNLNVQQIRESFPCRVLLRPMNNKKYQSAIEPISQSINQSMTMLHLMAKHSHLSVCCTAN
mmetsp:Transcript_5386/g.9306  ORF Transcript_5386/g.9306 Transcript_5386/m.9306 type:complete len:140 (+) Transcript_5386:132-551(+)